MDAHATWAMASGDVDGDGDLDLVAGNYGQANRLYVNNGTANPASFLRSSAAAAWSLARSNTRIGMTHACSPFLEKGLDRMIVNCYYGFIWLLPCLLATPTSYYVLLTG